MIANPFPGRLVGKWKKLWHVAVTIRMGPPPQLTDWTDWNGLPLFRSQLAPPKEILDPRFASSSLSLSSSSFGVHCLKRIRIVECVCLLCMCSWGYVWMPGVCIVRMFDAQHDDAPRFTSLSRFQILCCIVESHCSWSDNGLQTGTPGECICCDVT